MTNLKKRITLQRTDTEEGRNRAFQEIERVLNTLKIDEGGNIVVDGSGGPPLTTVGPQGPPGPVGASGPQGAPGLQGTMRLPETIAFNVPEEAPGVWSVGEASVRKKAILFRIAADQSCIVRLYNSATLRDSDTAALRLPTTNPGPGIILAEVGLDLSNDRTQYLAPTSVIYNADDPFTDTIYWAVQQTMVFDTEVNVELYLLPLEV